MKGKFLNEYVKNGKNVVVYEVSGTADELIKFRSSDSAKSIDKETGKDLWFTNRFSGNVVDIVVSKNNICYADTSELQRFASMAQAMGPIGVKLLEEKLSNMVKKPARQSAPELVDNADDELLSL